MSTLAEDASEVEDDQDVDWFEETYSIFSKTSPDSIPQEASNPREEQFQEKGNFKSF
jgi:hypothetical protein